MGVTSLVLGILGLLLSFVPCIGAYGLIFTIPGIVFGGIGISKAAKANQDKGLPIAGLVLSIIGTAIAIWWCMCIGAAAEAANDWDKAKQELSETMSKATKDLDKASKDLSKELDKASKELKSIKF